MEIEINNIYQNIPDDKKEVFQDLLVNKNFKVERIVSKGEGSPKDGKWYNQDKNEWVVLLSGSAGLRIEGEKDVINLNIGDYIEIPAHLKHRVEWTDNNQETIWLAIHY